MYLRKNMYLCQIFVHDINFCEFEEKHVFWTCTKQHVLKHVFWTEMESSKKQKKQKQKEKKINK